VTTSIRAQKVEIDLAKLGGTQWVSVDLQKIELDAEGVVYSTIDRDGRMYRKIEKVATELATFTDPVTGQIHTVSVAGIGAAITVAITQWMLADNPTASYDPVLGRVVLNDPVN